MQRQPLSGDAFTFVVLGDTQVNIDSKLSDPLLYEHFLDDAMAWIVTNADEENIRFVSQVGDAVQTGTNTDEYDRIAAKIALLDSASPNADGSTGIPWAISYGNHEVTMLDKSVDAQLESQSFNYRDYFATNMTPGVPFTTVGVHRCAGQPEFGASSPPPYDLNSWYTFSSSPAPTAREYLVLNLEFDIPGGPDPTNPGSPLFDALAWAQSIIDAHPGVPTIVQTHIFEGSQHGPPDAPYYWSAGRNSQENIFTHLIAPNPQIFLVVSGHTHEDTHGFKLNNAGQQVLQLVTDYTSSTKTGPGGGGYFRRIEFDEAAGEIRVSTYSATADSDGDAATQAFLTDPDSDFIWYFDWEERFGIVSRSTIAALAANNDSTNWISLILNNDGSGPCAGEVVKFPKATIAREDAETIINLAIEAFTHSKPIVVSNSFDSSCTRADSLGVFAN